MYSFQLVQHELRLEKTSFLHMPLVIFCSCTDGFVSKVFGIPEDRFFLAMRLICSLMTAKRSHISKQS